MERNNYQGPLIGRNYTDVSETVINLSDSAGEDSEISPANSSKARVEEKPTQIEEAKRISKEEERFEEVKRVSKESEEAKRISKEEERSEEVKRISKESEEAKRIPKEEERFEAVKRISKESEKSEKCEIREDTTSAKAWRRTLKKIFLLLLLLFVFTLGFKAGYYYTTIEAPLVEILAKLFSPQLRL